MKIYQKLKILSIIILIFISMFLIGCSEQSAKIGGETDKIQLLSYDFITKTNQNISYHNVSGTIKNIAGYDLNIVEIKVYFYDLNGNILDVKEVLIENLKNIFTADFGVNYYNNESYYEYVDNIGFEFTTS
jgi:hypothetical protein